MGRELRKVSADWEHPKQDNGKYHPMFDKFYGDALNEWIANNIAWNNGTHKDLINGMASKDEYPFFVMWGGECPDIDFYHTIKLKNEELTHIQLYETTSEGTPISPIFHSDKFDELCEWAAENATTFGSYKATKEEWISMLKNNFVFHQEGNILFA